MAGRRRMSSTSTLSSGSSGRCSWARSSLPSSLEDALVREYNQRFSASSPSPSATHLPRKYISPYASKGCRGGGSTGRSAPPTPDPRPPSTASQRNRSRRPRSSPSPQLRRSRPPSRSTPPVYERQPAVIRVTAHKNGCGQATAKIAAPTFTMLLEECTSRLKLVSAARRLFLEEGREVSCAADIPKDAVVYVSSGEAFLDPREEMRAHLSLGKQASWSLSGVVLPAGPRRGRSPPLSRRLRGPGPPVLRLLAFRNGAGTEARQVAASAGAPEQFLDLCTQKLQLTSPAKLLFDWEGNPVRDIGLVPPLDNCLQCSATPLRGPVWVSRGEWFSPSGAKAYIRGALGALRGKLRPATDYLEQLNMALENSPEKVWKKEILSMTVRELREAREKVQREVEEVRASLRRHQAQLSALAPLIRAEEQRPGGYVSQHVRPLPDGPSLPHGLQLKLLRVIHQRLGARPTHGPCGPRSFPARLFDQWGQAVLDPSLLRNEQAVWVSYGEDYRPPRQAALTLALERATAVEEQDYRAVFRAPLDPDAELPAGFRKWKVWEGFPPNYVSEAPGASHLADRVDPDAHFIQLKSDPQTVLFPSAHVVDRAGPAGPSTATGSSQGTGWPLSHVWIITKTGLILSRVLPQLCLAVSAQPVTLTDGDAAPAEAFPLNVQKRVRDCPDQEWIFGKEGHIFPRVRPEFVLTFRKIPSGATLDDQGAREAGRRNGGAHAELFTRDVGDAAESRAARSTDGSLGGGAQLTVALLRRRRGKQPQAAAQRWAIRQEGVGRSAQWKRSKVQNPLWNKLTYMWPTLPDGELNQDLSWPLEGALVPCAPPLTDSSRRVLDSGPTRLRVLRNGQQGGHTQAVTVTAPDTTNMLKTRKKPQTDRGDCLAQEDDSSIKIHKLQFQQFLERCGEALGLLRAARRLFDKDGEEISVLTGLQRDQLVYVSCGEQWADPRRQQADRKRRVLLNGLEQDAALLRHYCTIRQQQDLVLEAVGDLREGNQLTVAERCISPEETSKEPSNQEPTNQDTDEENTDEDLLNMLNEDSHSRAHRKLDEKHLPFRYPWQENWEHHEDVGTQNDKDESSNKVEVCKPRLGPRQRRATQAQLQHFELRDGQIVSCQSPGLALGVRSTEGARAGMTLQLLTRNPDDTNQRWELREEDQTLHLLVNPGLVLAVSMSKITAGHTSTPIPIPGCPVILQKHKPYRCGAAHQRWGWLPEVRGLGAFFTTELDRAVTAALRACLCTACVSPEPLHQQGYFLVSSGGTRRVEMCSTCAKILRGKHVLQKLPPDSIFRCSTARRDPALSPHGPFKILTVCKTDLAGAAAEAVLRGLEERLECLKAETRPSGTPSACAQPAPRILAHRNGRGLRGGQLITAVTVPLMLAQCTLKLQLPRAASRLYTADGTQILSVPQLKAWTINECLQEHCAGADPAAPPTNPSDAHTGGCPGYEPLPQVTAEDLDAVDEDLQLLILRSPVHLWVSCGEPFIPVEAVQRKQEQRERSWLQKEKVLAELLIKKHKIRHLQGRRISGQSPARMVPTLSPAQPVVVEGGWTQASQEELQLMEDLHNMETHLAGVETAQAQKSISVPNRQSQGLQDLYNQPDVKRVRAYRNGNPKQAAYVWGRSIEELLSNSGPRLGLPQPAVCLYRADGGPLRAWAEVQRDMLVCVSAGGPFLTAEDCREKIEMKARYARAKKNCGSDGIRLEMETKKCPAENTAGRWLALPWDTEAENQIPITENQ